MGQLMQIGTPVIWFKATFFCLSEKFLLFGTSLQIWHLCYDELDHRETLTAISPCQNILFLDWLLCAIDFHCQCHWDGSLPVRLSSPWLQFCGCKCVCPALSLLSHILSGGNHKHTLNPQWNRAISSTFATVVVCVCNIRRALTTCKLIACAICLHVHWMLCSLFRVFMSLALCVFIPQRLRPSSRQHQLSQELHPWKYKHLPQTKTVFEGRFLLWCIEVKR